MGRKEQKHSATLPLKIPDLKNDKAYVKLFSPHSAPQLSHQRR